MRHPILNRRLLQKLALLWGVIFIFTACRDEEFEPIIDDATEQTVIFFMPWSTNMTPYFEQNIIDFETAIKDGLLRKERIIVCIASTTQRANVIELRQEQGQCVRDTLKFYSQPDFTKRENITTMLNDVRAIAPARRYSLIIGCHGMGWLPSSKSRARSQYHFGLDNVPLTRWFGGFTSEYQIETTTLADAIKEAGMRMDYIMFDDCYMSSVEVAYDLKDVTDYLIGSPTEIMIYGFPYHLCARYLVGTVNYAALCQTFYDFYSHYTTPCGTIAVTDCRELDVLAHIVRDINLTQEFDYALLADVQRMDGYIPTLFYDLGDYIAHLCTDKNLLDAFNHQLDVTIPYKAHTAQYYSASNGLNDIRVYSGITTSAPSRDTRSAGLKNTKWYQATH